MGLILRAGVLVAGLDVLHRVEVGADGGDPEARVVGLVRLLGLVGGWYVVAVGVVGLVARLGRAQAAVRALDRVTMPGLRRALDLATGLSVAAAVALPPVPVAATGVHDTRPAVTVARLPDTVQTPDGPAPDEASPPPVDDPGQVLDELEWLGEPDQFELAAETPTTTTTAAATPVTAPPPTPSHTPSADGVWEVGRDEHFWSIAERVSAEAWSRVPTDREVDPYWRTLVETNRDRLADRDNPDLLFAGQVLTVPDPPSAPP